jgi:hypothetical protein
VSRVDGPRLPRGKIIGRCINLGADETDSEHVMLCLACGQAFDMRDLGEVLHHDEPGHAQIACD